MPGILQCHMLFLIYEGDSARPLRKCEIILLNIVFRCISVFYHTKYCISKSIQIVSVASNSRGDINL